MPNANDKLGQRGIYSIQKHRYDLDGGVAITVYVQRPGEPRLRRASRSLKRYFDKLGLSIARSLNDLNCRRVVELVRQEVLLETAPPAGEPDTELVGLLDDYIEALEAVPRSASHVARTKRRILATLGRSTHPRNVPRLKWKRLGDVNRRELSAYLVKRRNAKPPAEPDECNHDLKAWRAFMSWAVRHDYLETNPLAGIPQYEVHWKPRRVLEPEEIQRLVDACGRKTVVRRGRGKGRRPPVPGAPAWLERAVMMLTYTGLRPSELARARWEDVDLDAGALTVRRKSGGTWTVPLADILAKYLKRTPDGDRHGPLVPGFPYEADSPHGGGYFRAVRTAARNAKLEGVTLYLLRHSAATHLAAAGEKMTRLMAIFGWKTPAMAARYVHLAAKDLAGATNALPYNVLPAPERKPSQKLHRKRDPKRPNRRQGI